MTIFGPDISSYERGLDVTGLPDPFVIAKCTEGTYYTDANYDSWRQQAKASRKAFVAYHFLSGEDAGAQADHLAAHIGDAPLPVMVDFEPEGNFSPTLAQLLAFVDACVARRLRPRLAYVPRWFWAKIGQPDLSGIASRGLGVISSAYPGGSGTAEQIYPGDYSAAGWQPYGGIAPMLYQFTNQAADGGQLVDMNAYRGTLAELAAFLQGDTMPQIPPSISQKWTDLAGDFPPGADYTDETALIWADAGARAAALFAQQANAKLDQLLARPAMPPVDVDALAAALVPKLSAGTQLDAAAVAALADQLAHAVAMHLGADLAAG